MPALTDALFNQGLELARAGRLAEARDRLTAVVTLGPTDVDAWVVLGKVQAQRGDLEAANDCWREALRLAPDRADVKASVARAETLRRGHRARGRRLQALWVSGLAVMLMVGYAGGAWRGAGSAEAPAAGGQAPVVAGARPPVPVEPTATPVATASPSPSQGRPTTTSLSPSPALQTTTSPAPSPAGQPSAMTPAPAALPLALSRLLSSDPRKRFAHVTVSGTAPLTLSGRVSTDDDRLEAIRLARAVLGAAPVDRLTSSGLALYTLQRGDTLWSVADRYYGDGDQWIRILRANRGLPRDPTLTPEGTVIVVPKVR